ncbi:uncharacterized protein LOC130695528 [Daphnia carinata]|uniref:uncharacterized protein LOC130695528 n=1 Tax=Daphnia carinata TaxID=120202 RepID=UPI00257ED0C7|nr:uncharacterized protein LOC130695528 [Daphnia carinata]
MYGRDSHEEKSEEEYDVFAEAEKDKVVKTFSKEFAISQIKWNNRQDGELFESYKELVLVDPTENSETSTGAAKKTLQHRAPRLNSIPAGVLFSSLASSMASQDTSVRSDTKNAASHAVMFTSGTKGGEMDPGHKKLDAEALASHFTSELGLDMETRNRYLKKSAFGRTTTQ